MNEKFKVLSAFFWKFAERIGAQSVSIIVSVILARLLSPSEYGIIPLASVFITIASVFADSGFGMSLIQKRDADDIDFSTVFYFSLIFSVFIYFILFFLAVPISTFYGMPILRPVTRVLATCIIIQSVNSVQNAYVSRHLLFKKYFYSTIIGIIVSGIVGIVLAYYEFGVWALVAQTLTNYLINTIILQFIIDWKPVKSFSFIRLKGLFGFGWKLLLQNFILQLYANMRSLVIGKIYTPEDLAFYTKGKQFPELISNNVDTAISTVIFPTMSANQDSKLRVKEIARKTTQVVSYIMSPILIDFFVIADSFISIILTKRWLPCVPYLRICCIVLLFRPPQTAILQAIKAIGRSDKILLMDIPIRVFALVILFFSIRHGVLIFAFSEILITVFGTILNIIMAKKLLLYTPKEVISDFMINIIIATVMGFLVYLVGKFVWSNDFVKISIQLITGLLTYFFISFFTKNKSYRFFLNTAAEIFSKGKKI